MKGLRPLLLQKINIRLPGVDVMQLRIHRHLPEVDRLETHSHRHGQLLCYLSGAGTLIVGNDEHAVLPGMVAWIPAGTAHAFRETSGRRPLCLALDIKLQQQPKERMAMLNHSESVRMRLQLSELGQLKDPASMEAKLLTASRALSILDIQFRALGFLPREPRPTPGFIKSFTRLAADPGLQSESVGELARRMGQDPDYLNRRFKRETGLTLRQQRDAIRLEAGKASLLAGSSVGEAAEKAGFDDLNYFSRWFKRHTGVAPSRFAQKPAPTRRKGHSDKHKK